MYLAIFRFIQVVLGISTGGVVLSTILGIVGYLSTRFGKICSIVITGVAILLAVFWFYYVSFYFWCIGRETFIFTKYPKDIPIHAKEIHFTILPILLIPVIVVVFMLGAMVSIHNFDEDRKRMENERRESEMKAEERDMDLDAELGDMELDFEK
ncbi:hypothetical protein RF11_11664 [Thelohanellus kitauei]|uniref:Uncharacterized protein n=1 Tax=Thelohanellus kitauei TaxID=669202 RepID=A0A0C2MUE7_THEKT|nr:hypothetical protein RF11_11664 [Thelohanellus kitauei]